LSLFLGNNSDNEDLAKDQHARSVILDLAPHLDSQRHRLVVEHNECVMMRECVCSGEGSGAASPWHPSLARILVNAFEQYSSRPCYTSVDITSSSSSSSSSSSIMQVQYSTFAEELYHRILFITRALYFSTPAQARVAICLRGSRLWYNIETAILMRRAVSAGLPDSWASSEILQVAHRANVHTLFIGAEVMKSKGLSTDKLTEAIPSLRLIVIVDDDVVDAQNFNGFIRPGNEQAAEAKEAKGRGGGGGVGGGEEPSKAQVMSFSSFLSKYNSLAFPTLSLSCLLDEVEVDGSDDDESMILFSSGSTGTPKGVIQTITQTRSGTFARQAQHNHKHKLVHLSAQS